MGEVGDLNNDERSEWLAEKRGTRNLRFRLWRRIDVGSVGIREQRGGIRGE